MSGIFLACRLLLLTYIYAQGQKVPFTDTKSSLFASESSEDEETDFSPKISLLDTSEIIDGLKWVGLSKDQIDDFFDRLDANRDGELSRPELIVGRRSLLRGDMNDSELRAVFLGADQNSDGKISANEIYSYLKEKGEKVDLGQIKKWIHNYDRNKDGQFNYGEYYNFIRNTF